MSVEQIENGLKSYCHIPTTEADSLHDRGMGAGYRVETINWTYAKDHDEPGGGTGRLLALDNGEELSADNVHKTHVHRNVYSFTLSELVEFIRDTVEVAEDVVSIEPE